MPRTGSARIQDQEEAAEDAIYTFDLFYSRRSFFRRTKAADDETTRVGDRGTQLERRTRVGTASQGERAQAARSKR